MTTDERQPHDTAAMPVETVVNGSAAEQLIIPGVDGVPPIELPYDSAQNAAGDQQALRELLARYPYFDRDWYVRTYDDVRRGSLDALQHYVTYGIREKRSPNPYFDPVYYRENAPHAIAPDRAELLDYHERGWWLGAQPSAAFDTLAYLEAYPDVAEAGREPLAHYLTFGRAEDRPIFAPKRNIARPAHAFPSLLAPKYRKLLSTLKLPAEAGRDFDPRCLRIAWIIPDFDPGAGGHMAIFKAIYWLEYLGHEISIWIDYPNARIDAVAVYEEIVRYFRPVKARVRLLDERSVIRADVVMATDHQTVWSARKHAVAKRIFYFVQDFEPLFFGAGSDAIVADKTYDLSLFCFCSSPWLAEKMRARGSSAVHFTYPADTDIYYPAVATRKPPDIPKIALYARFFTSRRAVELALLGLTALARRGERFTVALFGQQLDEASEWPFPVEFRHVLTEPELAELYRSADIGLVFSTTNYSIAAIEMMACGLPVVDLANDSTLTTYAPGIATLVGPLPEQIADGIQGLLHDAARRDVQVQAARQWVSGSEWSAIARMMADTMVVELNESGFARRSAAPSIGRQATRISVVIPTLNAGADFARVLDRVLAQSGPFELDVLCIDSGSTDGTVETITARHKPRLIRIPQREFNHGSTRNLAVEHCDSDYVAFLTQDALPASERWLFDLAGLLKATPSAALAFGRHLAYPAASPFVRRDLQLHFDKFRAAPLIVGRDTNRQALEARDEAWLGFLRFNSDNNSCISRQVWESLPLPAIDFGEDQLWAWQIITAGYAKIYVDSAAVYHSHDYDPEQTRRRARTEAGFFKHVFGLSTGIRDQEAFDAHLSEMNRGDLFYALKNAIPREITEVRFMLNRAVLEGQWQGEIDGDIVYATEPGLEPLELRLGVPANEPSPIEIWPA